MNTSDISVQHSILTPATVTNLFCTTAALSCGTVTRLPVCTCAVTDFV